MFEYPSLIWFLALVPLFYLAIPLLILAQQKLPAHPSLQELEMQALEPEVAEFIMAKTREMFDLGFDEPTLLQIPNPAPNVTAYLVVLLNRATGHKAMVTALIGEEAVKLRAMYIEFSTRFDDLVFDTLNTKELSAFPPGPKTIRTQTPSVTDTRELFELHQYVIRQHDVRGKPMLYEPGGAKEYLTRYAFEKAYRELAERGWLVYREAGDCYVPTLKGAYLMTWGLLPPFKQFRAMALRRREKVILDEFRKQRAVS